MAGKQSGVGGDHCTDTANLLRERLNRSTIELTTIGNECQLICAGQKFISFDQMCYNFKKLQNNQSVKSAPHLYLYFFLRDLGAE